MQPRAVHRTCRTERAEMSMMTPGRRHPHVDSVCSSEYKLEGTIDGDCLMSHERFLRRAIELSREAVVGGYGLPFGTVIVKDGEIVGEGYNMVTSTNDPTAHAEVVAIRDAAKASRHYDLSGCDLYVNGPPCCMCLGTILWARIHVSSMSGR